MNIVIIPAFFQTKHIPTLGNFFMEKILYCDTYSVKCVKEWLVYEEETKTQIDGIMIYREKRFCPLKHGMEGHKEAFAKGIERLWGKYIKNQKVDMIHAHCCVWAGYAAMKMAEKDRKSVV